jgi:hypothetical protein
MVTCCGSYWIFWIVWECMDHCSVQFSFSFCQDSRWAGSLVLYFVQAPWSWSFHYLVGVLASYFWVNLRLLQLSSTWGNSKCHRFLRLYWYYIWWFVLRCSFKYYGWQNVCLFLPYFAATCTLYSTPSKASVLEQASDVLWRRLFCFSWNGYHHLFVAVPEQFLFVSDQCSVVNVYTFSGALLELGMVMILCRLGC